MSTTRKKIRNLTTELLKSVALVDADNVRASRIRPNPKTELPAINIYTTGEVITDNGESPLLNKRFLTLVCEIVTSDPLNDNGAVDQGDDIAQQVEDLMFIQDANANLVLGCIVNDIRLQSITLEIEGQGESAVNSARLAFGITYYEEAVNSAPDNTNDLSRIGAGWDVGTASDPDPEAQDIIQLGP